MIKNIEWLNNEVEKRIEKIKTDEVSFVGIHFFDEGYIHGMRDVQSIANLLVPKQELPVIPKFVGDILEENTFADLPTAFEELFSANAGHYYGEDVCKWIVSNDEAFARAWLDGYTVEEEQKYRVLDGNTTLLGRINGLMLTTVEILEYYPEYAPTFDLTEQEIKDYDPRYMAFAKPVEELEE